MSRTEMHAEEDKRKNKRGLSPFGRFLDMIGTFIMVFTILLCLVLMAPRLAGIQTYVVISGSMEPAIPVGSLVYSTEAEPSTLEAGDVIVFYNSNAGREVGSKEGAIPVTHRVVSNDTAAGEIITKGDANENNDISPVLYNNVEGKVVFHVPKLGLLAALFATVQGKIAAVMMILAGYLLTEAGSRMKR